MSDELAQWQFAKLIQALQLVAADAETQIAALPSFVWVADEVVLTYADDAYLLVDQIVDAGLLDPSLVPRLDAINEQIGAMSGADLTELWTDDALRTRSDWESLRVRARAVLADLGIELAPPNLGWITYVGGKAPGQTKP